MTEVKVELDKESAKFWGVQGAKKFEFALDLNAAIDAKNSSWAAKTLATEILLKKEKAAWWPHILKDKNKYKQQCQIVRMHSHTLAYTRTIRHTASHWLIHGFSLWLWHRTGSTSRRRTVTMKMCAASTAASEWYGNSRSNCGSGSGSGSNDDGNALCTPFSDFVCGSWLSGMRSALWLARVMLPIDWYRRRWWWHVPCTMAMAMAMAVMTMMMGMWLIGR
jgi:hypothetical protein